MTTPPSSSSASQSQFTYSNPSYFPVPFHLQQPATTHYAAPYVAAPSVQIPAPPVVGPVAPAPVPGVYSTVPQYQAQQLFERDAQIITPEALENVKAANASSDVEHKTDANRKAVPRKAADDYRLFCGDLGNEVNDDVLSNMHDSSKRELQRQGDMRRSLRSGLGSLPQPKNEYQIVMETVPEDAEEHEEKIEEDMSDRIAREKMEEEARQQALFRKRSNVLQRELPRPPAASLELIRNSLMRIDGDKSSFVPPTSIEQADEMNPSYPSSSLSSTLSSLKNLISLSNQVLSVTPSPPTLNANLIQCPFNPHHLVPPHFLFHHHLRCPSSPRPLPDLTHSLTYPQTLHNSPSDQLSFYLHSLSNFFYRDCPAVVAFSHADALARTATLTLPPFLSFECADTDTHSNLERVSHHAPILPSQYFSIARELQSWNDFPTAFSNSILRAILGLGIANDCELTDWIIANSPRFGLVVDAAMQQHMFLLCCLCLKSIIREASASMGNQNSHVNCPVSNQSLTWLAYQVSILYGAANGKAFVLNFMKKCITVGASALLLFPLGDETSSKQESQNLDTEGRDMKDVKPAAPGGEKKNSILNRKIFVSQVAAAVAALHERSLLEQKIKGFWFSQQPSNYQLVAEHSYLSEKANEERTKRPDYRPIIDHDGVRRPRLSNQESSREKTREELLAEERDYKRRRMSYRGKRTNQSPLQVMRYMIDDFMEQIKQAGGFENPVKMSEERGSFPSKTPGHEISVEANSSRKASRDSPTVTTSNPHYREQQSHSNCCDESKNLDDAFSRDYKQLKHEHHRSHCYGEEQRNADRGKYHRAQSPTSPERHSSHSRSREHSNHHNKQDYYSNRKKHDNSSRFRDRWKNDTHRSHISGSFPNKTFSDRYDPSEFVAIYDDISTDAKYIKSHREH